jgi:LmbE family N-acetylglucosaminyl deacetylase
MNVLAVGAHFDDAELGCGGTLARHVREGHQVAVYVATHSGYANPAGKVIRTAEEARREGERAAQILGVELLCGNAPTNQLVFGDELVCRVLAIVEERAIDTMYIHWDEDVHQDHRALALACVAAGKHVPRILMYQSNLYESGKPFCGNFRVDITPTMEQKRLAIQAHASELGRVGGQWLEVFTHRCRVEGYRAGTAYAEAFAVVKYLVP